MASHFISLSFTRQILNALHRHYYQNHDGAFEQMGARFEGDNFRGAQAGFLETGRTPRPVPHGGGGRW
jgi:hypothetical protein